MATTLRPKILTEERLIEVQRLNYDILLEEEEYWPGEHDPAGERVEPGPMGPLYVDDFERVSTNRGLVDQDDILIASHRESGPINGDYHLERFLARQGTSLPRWLKDAEMVEVNRFVIKKPWRHTTALIDLLAFEIQDFMARGVRYIVTAAAFPRPGNLWVRLGMRTLDLPPFRMNPSDKHELTVLYGDLAELASTGFQEVVRLLEARRAA